MGFEVIKCLERLTALPLRQIAFLDRFATAGSHLRVHGKLRWIVSERLNCGLGGTVLALTGFLVLIRMHNFFALKLPSLLKELRHLGRKSTK